MEASVALARAMATAQLADHDGGRMSHVEAVARLAGRLAAYLRVDERVLVSAAWLHDIGYAPAIRESGFHPLDGARFLRRVGFDEEVILLVAHHSAAFIEAEVRGVQHELLSEFPFERSLLMDALWYCDMTTGPRGEPMCVEDRLAEIRARYGPGDVVTRFVKRAEPELVAAVRRVEERLAAVQSR